MVGVRFMLKGGGDHICTGTEFKGNELYIIFKGGFAPREDCYFFEP